MDIIRAYKDKTSLGQELLGIIDAVNSFAISYQKDLIKIMIMIWKSISNTCLVQGTGTKIIFFFCKFQKV